MMLRGEDVHVRLAGREVLAGVSIDCAPGRITGLIGPNGAGKSTLLRALAGLVPLARGSVTIDGQVLAAMPAHLRGRQLAYLPQERMVHWPLAARHVVALGRLPHGPARGTGGRGREETLIDAALETMDVAHLRERSVAELSGGELARVLFARTLAQEAPIILADEPTAGLDPAHALALFEVLARLAAEGRTVVVALHDLSLAARFCQEVVILASGVVASAGTPAVAMTEARLSAVFSVRMAVGEAGGVPVVVPLSPLA